MDVAVVKATNHDVCTPKEKHVRTILAATDGRRRREDVLYCLCQLAARLKSSHYLVVLKTLMVFHRLLRDGSHVAANQLQVRDLLFPAAASRLCTLRHLANPHIHILLHSVVLSPATGLARHTTRSSPLFSSLRSSPTPPALLHENSKELSGHNDAPLCPPVAPPAAASLRFLPLSRMHGGGAVWGSTVRAAD